MNAGRSWPLIFLAISSFFASLLAAEGILHFLNYPKFYNPPKKSAQLAPFLENSEFQNLMYINAPSSDIIFQYDGNLRGYFSRGNTVHHRTNKLGFRGPEFKQKGPRNFRFLFLGDSFTFGEGVHYEDTLPELVKKELSGDQFGMNVECLNLGVGGYNTVQEYSLLKLIGRKLAPDAVFVIYTLNDAEPFLFNYQKGKKLLARRSRERETPDGAIPAPPKVGLWNKSKIRQLVWMFQKWKTSRAKTIAHYKSLYLPSSSSWIDTQQAIKGVGEECRARRVPCYAVVYPLLFDLSRYPFKNEHALIRQCFEESNIPVLDLLDYLPKQNTARLWVHPTDQHPNEIVHREAASAISDLIKQNSPWSKKQAS